MTKKVEIAGATALVTGAGSGIGRATALALARKGATVLAVDLDETSAKTTADSCREHAVEAAAYQCDVADARRVDALAEEVEAGHGPLDILVSNAGVGMTAQFLDMSLADWEWIRSINLDGGLNCCGRSGRRWSTGAMVRWYWCRLVSPTSRRLRPSPTAPPRPRSSTSPGPCEPIGGRRVLGSPRCARGSSTRPSSSPLGSWVTPAIPAP